MLSETGATKIPGPGDRLRTFTALTRGIRAATRKRVRNGLGAIEGLVPVFVGTILAAATIISGIILTQRADRSHDARTQLIGAERDLERLQSIPWTVLDPQPLAPGNVANQMARAEHQVEQALDDLQRRSPVAGLRAGAHALKTNFAADEDIRRTLVDNPAAPTGPLEARQHHASDQVVNTLNVSAQEYETKANAAEAELIAVMSATILALLLAFGLFYCWGLRRRRAAEALAEELTKSEAHLEEAQRLARLGSWEWDAAKENLRCSPEWARLHGRSLTHPARTLEELLEPVAVDDRAKVTAAISAALEQGRPASLEYRTAADAGIRLINLAVTLARDTNAKSTGVLIGTAQDITESCRLAEAQRANEAKSQFISRMSHELRTPLNAILGFGQLLSLTKLDRRQHDHLHYIMTAGKQLLGLINEILDIARVESGELRISPESVAVGAAITAAIDLVAPIAEAREITLTIEPSENEIWVQADVQRLNQVLLNLLTNAIKYNRDGGHVTVRATCGGDVARIGVADDGAGIPPALIGRLFEPFDRLGAEQSSVDGTGLGLALAKGMVEAMGGTITVDSRLGHGSVFTVELRTADAPASHAALLDVGERPQPMAAGEHSVLSIEDNPSNLALIERVIWTRPNIGLLTATQGSLGLVLAREHRPDVVLLDSNLPDIPGSEVLARLKSDPDLASTPVVVVSADATPGHIARMLAQGAHAYLTKPIDVAEMLQTIDSLLQEQTRVTD